MDDTTPVSRKPVSPPSSPPRALPSGKESKESLSPQQEAQPIHTPPAKRIRKKSVSGKRGKRPSDAYQAKRSSTTLTPSLHSNAAPGISSSPTRREIRPTSQQQTVSRGAPQLSRSVKSLSRRPIKKSNENHSPDLDEPAPPPPNVLPASAPDHPSPGAGHKMPIFSDFMRMVTSCPDPKVHVILDAEKPTKEPSQGKHMDTKRLEELLSDAQPAQQGSPWPQSTAGIPAPALHRTWVRWRNCLGVALVAVIALSVVTTAVLLLRRHDVPPCETHLCQYYARLLESTLSKVVHPCDDFHKYVCEGWERENSLSVRESMLNRFVEKVLTRARQSVAPETNQTAVQKAAAFYMSCESAYSGQANEFETAKEDLVKHGVFWPEIRNSSNLIQMLFSLSAVWNWGTIVEVQMIRNGHFTIAPTPFYNDTLQRRDDMLKNSQNSGRDFYREYFDKMVTEFRRKRSGEVLSYEQLLALEKLVIPKILGPFMASNFTTIRNKSLGDMLNITGIVTSKVTWENSIHKYFNYTPGSPYVFTVINVEFFTSFFSLIDEVGEPEIAYYIGWVIAQPASLLSEAKLIRYYYMTDAKAREGQLRFCSGNTHRYIGLPFYAAYMRDQMSPDKIQDTSVLVHRLRKSLVQAVENSSTPWNQLATALYTPNETAEAEGSAFRLFSEAAEEPLNARYAAFPDMGTSVFSNMERATKGRRQTSESTMMESFRIRHDARVYYLSDQGFVFLPIAFELPLYQKGAPYAVKYGALGGEIADALA
ncbi:uncharacterized protein LOC144154792, partial [Haemaphysalis longicornis]